MDKGRAFTTVKVYLAAISACHVGFGKLSAGCHPLIRRFMKGARRLRPPSKLVMPSWDLPLVLRALSEAPFEPLEGIGMKLLTLKTALLIALVSAKRVSELQAFSTHSLCMAFNEGRTTVTLRLNPAFIPKVIDSPYVGQAFELRSFYPPPFSSPEEERLHSLCPVRALRVYLDRTKGIRKSDQLFISWAPPHTGKPVSKQRISHWLVDAIGLAYEARGLQPPERLRAHSTRGMGTSWALFRGISAQDICVAGCWASPDTFVRYYRLDVTAPSLAHAVLSV